MFPPFVGAIPATRTKLAGPASDPMRNSSVSAQVTGVCAADEAAANKAARKRYLTWCVASKSPAQSPTPSPWPPAPPFWPFMTSAPPLTVLVVDDHAGARDVIGQLLEAKGYGVVTAASGAEAIETLRANPAIGAIVTDVTMPDMTGVELAYYVRDTYPRLPVAIVSGDIGELERSVIARAGVPFLKKPVRAEALYGALQEAVTIRS